MVDRVSVVWTANKVERRVQILHNTSQFILVNIIIFNLSQTIFHSIQIFVCNLFPVFNIVAFALCILQKRNVLFIKHHFKIPNKDLCASIIFPTKTAM